MRKIRRSRSIDVRRCKRFVVLLTALIIAVGGVPAFAGYGYTDVNAPPASEKDHAYILGAIYEQDFTADGLDYLGDTGVNAYRVYDFDEELIRLHIINGDESDIDQIWCDGIAMVTAEAKWAGMDQSFGWNQGGLDPCYTELLTDADLGGSVLIPIPEGDFLWGYTPNSEEWWSWNALNDGLEDHMVSYFIEGASLYGETVWMIFMEDKPLGESDCDYNDFVVEIRAIPEPASMLLLGLGALALLRKRRH